MSAFTDTTTFKAIQAFKVRQDNYNSDTFVAKTDAGDSNVIENISVDGVNQQINSDTKTATIDLSAYAKKSELGSVLTYKCSVLNMAALPTDTSVLKIGDVYNLEQAGGVDIKGIAVTAGDNVAWTGNGWDVLAGSVDLSNYLTETIASETYLAQSDASDTYLAQSDAETIYLAQSDAAANYVSNSNLQVTLSGYVQTETGKSLSTNDFTTAEKSKLGGIETGAQVNKIETVSIDGTIQTINSDTKVLVLDLSNFATKADISSVFKYKGSVQSFSALPSNAAVGDVYNIEQAGGTDANGTAIKAGDNVAWTGSGWDVLAGTIDLSGYLTKTEAGNTYLTTANASTAYLTKTSAAATYITNASLQSALSAAVPSGVVLSTVASTVEGAIWIGE